MEATSFPAATHEYFRGGFSTHFATPLTVARLNLVKGVGLVLQIAEGATVLLDDAATAAIVDRTDPTWPTTFFVRRLTGKVLMVSVCQKCSMQSVH
ncbi:hypothetical protein [Corynebacterium freiburgense]|uniref:hypothetical protein n=1 Tax=Corynebacterium freiburgense TaxID=556548 RepID=UPI001F0ABDF8